jgi:hypothetical protein
MKTKAEQLEELKATAVKLQRQIEALEKQQLQQQIEALEKPKQWEPTVDLDWVDRAHISTSTLLLKYVKEFDYFWEADWSDSTQEKGYVYYNYIRRRWSAASWVFRSCEGAVYMSQDCAKDLAAKLNSGEVVL